MQTKLNERRYLVPGIPVKTIAPNTRAMQARKLSGKEVWVSIGNCNQPWPGFGVTEERLAKLYPDLGNPTEYLHVNLADVGIVEDTPNPIPPVFTPGPCDRCTSPVTGKPTGLSDGDDQVYYHCINMEKDYTERFLCFQKEQVGTAVDGTPLTKTVGTYWGPAAQAARFAETYTKDHDLEPDCRWAPDTHTCYTCDGDGYLTHPKDSKLSIWWADRGMSMYVSAIDGEEVTLMPFMDYDREHDPEPTVTTLAYVRHVLRRFYVYQYNLWSADMVLHKYPRLTAHLICESLGYFSPKSAANAIASYLNGETFACEWYSHMCSIRTRNRTGKADYFNRHDLWNIGRDTLKFAFCNRKHHSGYMAEYQHAIALVKREVEGKNPRNMLASWF